MSLRRIFSYASYYYLLFAAAFLAALAAAFYLALGGYTLRAPAVRDYTVQRCQFAAPAGTEVLRVLDAVYLEEAQPLAGWCDTAGLAKLYGAVELRSVHRDHLDLREVYEGRYALILAKRELMSDGAVPAARTAYRQLAAYPDYGAQLLSLTQTPELRADWLRGKRFGLLDDPNSMSAYRIPLAALRRAGLEHVVQIVYYRSYRQLYRALFAQEVDVIPALLSEQAPDSTRQLPPGLVLEETLPGPAWYLRADLWHSAEHCALQAALKSLARGARYDFLRALRIAAPCDAP